MENVLCSGKDKGCKGLCSGRDKGDKSIYPCEGKCKVNYKGKVEGKCKE